MKDYGLYLLTNERARLMKEIADFKPIRDRNHISEHRDNKRKLIMVNRSIKILEDWKIKNLK